MYQSMVQELQPWLTDDEINHDVGKNFGTWFRRQVLDRVDTDATLRTLSAGPAREIKRYKGYYVNGYYFDIRQGDGNRSTYNSGVCVKGSCYDDDNHVDYYGVIEDIWELSYGHLRDKVVLFKCYWFDSNSWMQVHRGNGMVEINHTKRASSDDPFILASQAQQVYYLPYVSSKREHRQWSVAMKTNARSRVDWTHMQNVDVGALNIEDIFQEEQQPAPVLVQIPNDIDIVQTGNFDVVEGEVDVGHNDSDDTDYQSDYQDNESEQDYFDNDGESEEEN